jgi:acyl carrier protein
MTDQEKMKFIEDAIKHIFNKPTKYPILESDNLLDLGLDSLDIVELQMYYEDKTNQILNTDSRVVTVKDLMLLMK